VDLSVLEVKVLPIGIDIGRKKESGEKPIYPGQPKM
jgi:hypothetical protein